MKIAVCLPQNFGQIFAFQPRSEIQSYLCQDLNICVTFFTTKHCLMVAWMAQLVRSLPSNHKVTGSIPGSANCETFFYHSQFTIFSLGYMFLVYLEQNVVPACFNLHYCLLVLAYSRWIAFFALSDWFIKHRKSCAIHLDHSSVKKWPPVLLHFRKKKLFK